MSQYETDEEQVEALKRWWQENGKSILFGVALAIAGVYGWKGWESHQQTTGEAASNAYFSLLDAVAATETAQADDASRATANHLAETLKSEHEGTVYAQYASLLMAKQAVLASDLALAETELKWVVDRAKPDTSLYLIAKLRLARVIASHEGDEHAERALALIENQAAGQHMAAYEEAKGDIYLSLSRKAEALAAYRAAQTEAERLGQNKPLLGIKVDDLSGADS